MNEQSKLVGSASVLLVKDVVLAANHYRDVLGFSYERFWGEPSGFVILKRDGLSIMLKRADDSKDVVPNWTFSDELCDVYFWVSDVEGLYNDFKENGAKIDYEICDQPYDCREFGIRDLDGYHLAFGQGMKEKSTH